MWEPGLLWLHVISDSLIFVSYITIPLILVYIIRQRSDLIFSRVMMLFGLFVLLCGLTHLVAVWTVWNGHYWFSGSLKFVTALVSLGTAVMLWRLVPALKIIPTVEILREEVEARKLVEAQLKEKSDLLQKKSVQLQTSNEELERFAMAASHDLKSPLVTVSNLVGWIQQDLEKEGHVLSEQNERHFQMMDTRLKRMQNLLAGLLEYASVEEQENKLGWIDCNAHFIELFDMLNADNEMTLHCDAELPKFETLATPFTQVMRNLIDNSIKYRSGDGGNVWISADQDEEVYIFRIRDDGPGVATDDIPKISNIFTKLESADRVEGSGIGLALIARIMQRVGGEITFESESGKGFCAVVRWPVSADCKVITEPFSA